VDEWWDLADQAGTNPALAASIRGAAPALADLEATTAQGPGDVVVVGSHRDLDPKNALATPSGLLALDWDAAVSHRPASGLPLTGRLIHRGWRGKSSRGRLRGE
jgi:thiamine kinase-like enzyme